MKDILKDIAYSWARYFFIFFIATVAMYLFSGCGVFIPSAVNFSVSPDSSGVSGQFIGGNAVANAKAAAILKTTFDNNTTADEKAVVIDALSGVRDVDIRVESYYGRNYYNHGYGGKYRNMSRRAMHQDMVRKAREKLK